MSLDRYTRYWRGPLLSLIGITAALWLAAGGRLGWYIHPRYAWFTVIMCAVAALGIIAVVPVLRTSGDEHGHGSEADPRRPGARRLRAVRIAGAALLVAGTACALLVAPPATLSTEVAQQRQLGGGDLPGALLGDAGDAPGSSEGRVPSDSTDGSGIEPSVKEWAGALRQGGGTALEGRSAAVTGFVLADSGESGSTFSVARFAVSCCVVDAQPVGVPVLLNDWSASYAEGDWVHVDGVFVANPDPTSPHAVVLRPAEIVGVPEPEDPYVY